MDRQINIINWNVNGIKSKQDSVRRMLQEYDIDIAALTETKTRPGQQIYIPGYKTYARSREGIAGGGVMLLIKTDICSTKINYKNLGGQVEAVGALIEVGNRTLEMVSIYVPSGSIKREFLGDIAENDKVLIAGDMNAKHIAWGCSTTNRRGKDLLQVAEEEEFIVESPEDITLLPSDVKRRGEILDIFLRRRVCINKPKVLFEVCSDHLPVLTSLKGQATKTKRKTEQQTNWVKVQKRLSQLKKDEGEILKIEQQNLLRKFKRPSKWKQKQ